MIGGVIMILANDGKKVAIDLGRFISIEDHGQGGASLMLDGLKKPQRIDSTVDEFMALVETSLPRPKPPEDEQPPEG